MKTEGNIWENWRTQSRAFTSSIILPCSHTLSRFSPGYEGTTNMFYFFWKILLCYLAKRKTIYEGRVLFLSWTVDSYNLETAYRIAHVIFVLCFRIPMKTHLLTNQNARPIQIILWYHFEHNYQIIKKLSWIAALHTFFYKNLVYRIMRLIFRKF